MEKITLVYRTNDLFENKMGIVVRFLVEGGFQVKEKSFPKGTEDNEIEKWWKVQPQGLYLTDWTCWSNKHNCQEILDRIFDKAAMSCIAEELIIDKNIDSTLRFNCEETFTKETEEEKLQIVTSFFKGVFRNITDLPQSITICSKYILAHDPFRSQSRDEKEEIIGAKKISKTLKKAGYKGGIKIIPGEDQKFTIYGYGEWLIKDRHLHNEHLKGNVFDMPIGNFYQSLKKYGLLKPQKKEFEKNVAEATKKYIKEVIKML